MSPVRHEVHERSCGILPHRPVDMRRRRPLFDGPGLLQPLLQGHVPRKEVHDALQQLHQHPAAAGEGRQAADVQMRRPRGLRLLRHTEEHGQAVLPQTFQAPQQDTPRVVPGRGAHRSSCQQRSEVRFEFRGITFLLDGGCMSFR